MNLKSLLPEWGWIAKYQIKDLKGDLNAGLTVGVIIIPQGMAYAMIAGLPPIYGLYASTIPLIVYSLWGTSRQLAIGPVALISLLTLSGLQVIAEPGTSEFIALAILLTFLVGFIQLFFGLLRMGFLVNFLSHPVNTGFISAAALIIAVGQLKHLTGLDIPNTNRMHEILIYLGVHWKEINLPGLLIGTCSVGIILLANKIHRTVPGALIAVVISILVTAWLNLPQQNVQIVGEIPRGLPVFSLPDLNWVNIRSLIPTSLAITLIGFTGSIAIAKGLEAKHRKYRINSNKELIAIGLANIGGALFKSFPVTGGFARTAVNDQAGANTGLAGIISALLVILTLLLLTPLFYYLPNAVLASVIMVAVLGLIDWRAALSLWKTDRMDFWMLLATFISTLTLGVEEGIAIGVLLSLIMIIYRSVYPHFAVLGKIPETQIYRNIDRFKEVEDRDDLLIIRFDADLYFANINYFIDNINRLAQRKGKALKAIIIDAESISYVDSSALRGLKEMIDQFKTNEIRVLFSDVKGPVRDRFYKFGFLQEESNSFFLNISDTVNNIEMESKEPNQEYLKQFRLQSNLKKSKDSGPKHSTS